MTPDHRAAALAALSRQFAEAFGETLPFTAFGTARRDGEEWETNGRWYKRAGGKTQRIANPKGGGAEAGGWGGGAGPAEPTNLPDISEIPGASAGAKRGGNKAGGFAVEKGALPKDPGKKGKAAPGMTMGQAARKARAELGAGATPAAVGKRAAELAGGGEPSGDFRVEGLPKMGKGKAPPPPAAPTPPPTPGKRAMDALDSYDPETVASNYGVHDADAWDYAKGQVRRVLESNPSADDLKKLRREAEGVAGDEGHAIAVALHIAEQEVRKGGAVAQQAPPAAPPPPAAAAPAGPVTRQTRGGARVTLHPPAHRPSSHPGRMPNADDLAPSLPPPTPDEAKKLDAHQAADAQKYGSRAAGIIRRVTDAVRGLFTLGGLVTGAGLGATLGTAVAGPLGTALGTAVGGGLGGLLGKWGGSKVGRRAGETAARSGFAELFAESLPPDVVALVKSRLAEIAAAAGVPAFAVPDEVVAKAIELAQQDEDAAAMGEAKKAMGKATRGLEKLARC